MARLGRPPSGKAWKKTIGARLAPDLYTRLALTAESEEMTISALVETLLRDVLMNRPKPFIRKRSPEEA